MLSRVQAASGAQWTACWAQTLACERLHVSGPMHTCMLANVLIMHADNANAVHRPPFAGRLSSWRRCSRSRRPAPPWRCWQQWKRWRQ